MKQEYREALAWLRSCESDQLAASDDSACSYAASQLGLAIELIESSAVDPIPLSERKPGPDDRDHYGQCWWWGTSHTRRPAWVYASGWGTHWLPASTKYLPARVEG